MPPRRASALFSSGNCPQITPYCQHSSVGADLSAIKARFRLSTTTENIFLKGGKIRQRSLADREMSESERGDWSETWLESKEELRWSPAREEESEG
jgi:hypothetical protein